MNSSTGNSGGFNSGGMGNGGQNNGTQGQGQQTQSQLQAQLVQQLSQQLSQQMSHKFPQANILSALANAQSQMQNPRTQMTPDLMALARSGNLAGVANLLAGGSASNMDASGGTGGGSSQTNSQQASGAGGQQGGDEVRNRLLQQLSKTPNGPSTTAKDNKPVPPPSLGHVGEVRAGFQGQPSSATSANLSSDVAKDERRKAPGSVIVPCRARGMPMDHNFKTAYFVIPENVRHGEELICSYFACRNAGVKFRYCSHCKVPVAKRNFRKRHKHGDSQGGKDDDESGTEEDGCSEEGDSKETPSQGGIRSQMTPARSSAWKEAIPTQVTTKSNEGRNKKKRGNDRNKKSNIPTQVTTSSKSDKSSSKTKQTNGKAPESVDVADNSAICMRSGDERSKVIETRRQKWAALLEKRPQTKDGEAMSTWLMQVLAVSDLWKPLDESAKMPNASLDLIRECAQATKDATKKKSEATSGASTDRPSNAKAATSSGRDDSRANNNDNNDNGSGSSVSQESNNPGNSSENQDGNNAENSSNDSDNQDTETEGKGTTDEDKESSIKKKSMVLKKRPVVAIKNDDGKEEEKDKDEPPTKEQKR